MIIQRNPAVAGTFYEEQPTKLLAQVAKCFAANETPESKLPFIGGMVPHAGLMYSGHVAAALYALLEIPKRLIILCPNHTGRGRPVAIQREGVWKLPLGEMKIDRELADELRAETRLFEEDSTAHAREHSLEVQLPFLYVLDPEIRFVPVCIGVPRWDICESVGHAVAKVVARHLPGERIGILASSDLNHHQSHDVTMTKDNMVIERMLELDEVGLWKKVREEKISMCGVLPTTAMIIAAKQLGATRAILVKHATSGDINGDYNSVVGYASIAVC